MHLHSIGYHRHSHTSSSVSRCRNWRSAHGFVRMAAPAKPHEGACCVSNRRPRRPIRAIFSRTSASASKFATPRRAPSPWAMWRFTTACSVRALRCSRPMPSRRAIGYPRSPLDDLLVFHMVFGKTVPDISLNAVANLGYADCRFLEAGLSRRHAQRRVRSDRAEGELQHARPASSMCARAASTRTARPCSTMCAG